METVLSDEELWDQMMNTLKRVEDTGGAGPNEVEAFRLRWNEGLE